MSRVTDRILAESQRLIARSRLGTRIALKLRNQCSMVIGARLSKGNTLEASGEGGLLELLAPQVGYFVDVGANVGEWTLALARLRPGLKGVAFEPNPETARRLRENLAAGGLSSCEVIEAAAGAAEGRAGFFAETAFGETSSFYAAALRTDAERIEVAVKSLDDVLSARGVAQVDLLKIDAEGHDFAVLQGAQAYLAARRIAVVQFEYNTSWADAGSTLTRAIGTLRENGYQVALLNRDGLFNFDLRLFGEVFKYSNFVAYAPEGDLGKLLASHLRGPIL